MQRDNPESKTVLSTEQLMARIQQIQKWESLGVLAGGIAHDLNNLLMGILGNADLALAETAPEAPALDRIRAIEEAAVKAAGLTRQMLICSSEERCVVDTLNLCKLIEEMMHLLGVMLSKKAAVKYEFKEEVPPIAADPIQLRQIILNLAMNAFEALNEKGGVIFIRVGSMTCDREYLRETCFDDYLAEGLYSYFEISDTGCGMDETTVARIFDPFFTTKTSCRGLGLSAVLSIVRSHKGALKLYSEPGKGTSFKVLLPVTEKPDPGAQPAEPGAHERRFDGKMALFVDDEEVVRETGRLILERLGMKVTIAEEGRKALALFEEDPMQFDVVILDLTMPHMDGERALREMRRIRQDIPVVLSSGYDTQDFIARFAGMKKVTFLQKPYRLKTLSEKLGEII